METILWAQHRTNLGFSAGSVAAYYRTQDKSLHPFDDALPLPSFVIWG